MTLEDWRKNNWLRQQFRKKRNAAGYERAGMASDQEAKEMIALATLLRRKVEAWLKSVHPVLMR